MYFLEDSQGNVVRALQWPGDKLTFVLRHDTQRVESCESTDLLDAQGIDYTVLETLNKKTFNKSPSHTIKNLDKNIGGGLKLVAEANAVLKNVDLPKDNEEQLKKIMTRSSIAGAIMALFLLITGLLIHPEIETKKEPETVLVMDRKQLEKMIVLPPSPSKLLTQRVPRMVVKHTIPKLHKKVLPARQAGVLGILGSLKNSNQKGGLKLSQAETSAGIGSGGLEGSGGIQTSVYSKGMFAAPLGTGGKSQGAGGYGTKGKGGGRAGYGQVSLIGAGGNSFFEPVESEAWTEGGLDRNEIAAVIQRHLSEVRYCYEQGLQNKPNLAGRLSMKFMIGARGTVTLAQVENSSLRHVPVENCIRDHLKTWNFPQPQGGVTVKVNYPFILRRVSDS